MSVLLKVVKEMIIDLTMELSEKTPVY
ncbi:MAG TPA: cyclase family protein, partial [Thermococcaceae archaeon]|nr:cyclase family protein [Thermococcaceae archaeon]